MAEAGGVGEGGARDGDGDSGDGGADDVDEGVFFLGDEFAELADDDGQIGAAEVLAEVGEHLHEPGFVGFGGVLFVGIGFALVPEDAVQGAGRGGGLGAGEGLLIEIAALHPTFERRAADGAGDEADDGLRIGGEHGEGEGQAGADTGLGAADFDVEGIARGHPSAFGREGEDARVLDGR